MCKCERDCHYLCMLQFSGCMFVFVCVLVCENSQSVCVCSILHLSHLSYKALVAYELSSNAAGPVRDTHVVILTLGPLYKQSDQVRSQVKTLMLHVRELKTLVDIYIFYQAILWYNAFKCTLHNINLYDTIAHVAKIIHCKLHISKGSHMVAKK